MGRLCARALALAALLLASCHQVHDCIDEQVTTCRNQQLARYAWCRSRGNYVDCQDNLWDFGAGFRYGYSDILAGGKGCPPVVPPRSYWGCCYHGADGKCSIVAWYDGYQHGAAAALSDGYGADYSSVPTSIDLYRRCAGRPVQLDLEQYKAARRKTLHDDAESFDGPPLPSDLIDPAKPGRPEESYSPRTINVPDVPRPSPEAFKTNRGARGPVRISRIDEVN